MYQAEKNAAATSQPSMTAERQITGSLHGISPTPISFKINPDKNPIATKSAAQIVARWFARSSDSSAGKRKRVGGGIFFFSRFAWIKYINPTTKPIPTAT